METSNKILVKEIFEMEKLSRYFSHGANAQKYLDKVTKSMENLKGFGEKYTWGDIRQTKNMDEQDRKRVPWALQYYKDETIITLYAFAALDLLGEEGYSEQRKENFSRLMKKALDGNWHDSFGDPKLYLEKQLSPPKAYSDYLQPLIKDHSIFYNRVRGEDKTNLEGATNVDAVLVDNEENEQEKKVYLFEAKFVSDISCATTYAVSRNQIARNIDVGLNAVGNDPTRMYFVLITPKIFKENFRQRLYGYKMHDYQNNPRLLEEDFPHLRNAGIDFEVVSNHIGWITWEEIFEIIMSNKDLPVNRDDISKFFEDRKLSGN